MTHLRALPVAVLLALATAAPAHAVLIPRGGPNKPINAMTLKLEALGSHTLDYGDGSGRTGHATGDLKWTVVPPGNALAWPLKPTVGETFSRSTASGLTGSGRFIESGTAPMFPPNPPNDPFTCRGAVGYVQSTQLALARRATARPDEDGVSFSVRVPSFASVSVSTGPGGYSCSPSQAGPLYFGNALDAPASASFVVSQAELRKSVLRIPVKGGGQGLGCGGAIAPPCTQALGWSGTVTLEKACRNGSADAISGGVAGDPGISCGSPCKGAECDRPVLGVPVPKQIIKVQQGGTVKVKVECYGARGCQGRSKMFEVKAGKGSASARRKKRVLAKGRFNVAAGKSKRVKLKLTKAGRKRIRRKKRRVAIRFALRGKKVGERKTTLPVRVRR